jgi:hypothetical protein
MPTWLICQLFPLACMPLPLTWRATVADLQRLGFRRPFFGPFALLALLILAAFEHQ